MRRSSRDGIGGTRSGAERRGRVSGARARLAGALAGALSLPACSGTRAVPSAEGPPPGPETPGVGTSAPEGAEPAPPAAPHGKRAPCSTDQSCNDDPAVSALWGRCTAMGVCECREGFERSPTTDRCRPVE